jgi:hypothetical protein
MNSHGKKEKEWKRKKFHRELLLAANDPVQRARAISIQPALQQSILKTTLSRAPLQQVVGPRAIRSRHFFPKFHGAQFGGCH